MVDASTTLTDVTGFSTPACGFLVAGSTYRSRLNLAASALNGEPSWNFTPCRNLNRQVVSVGESHASARPGCGAKLVSKTTSVSKIVFMMLSENALVVTCGSRVSAST